MSISIERFLKLKLNFFIKTPLIFYQKMRKFINNNLEKIVRVLIFLKIDIMNNQKNKVKKKPIPTNNRYGLSIV